MPSRSPTKPPLALLLVRLTAVAYAAIGLWMMLAASPKVPYADPWRFLVGFLETPFPANVLAADNGHREVLPNLVRVAELHWFDANQWLQIGVGFGLALLTLATLLATLRRLDEPLRSSAGALVCIGLLWLGNARKLAHGNESVHLFLVQLCLIVGLRGLSATTLKPSAVSKAGLLAMAASMSFGAGAACFGAFGAVLWLRRAAWRDWLPLLGLAGCSALLLVLGNQGASPASSFSPFERLEQLLRWIGAPFVWVLDPLLDTGHAARMPTAVLRDPMLAIANPLEHAFGPPLTARWPGAAFGLFGGLWLLLSTWRSRRDPEALPLHRLCLGLAWFGFFVGVLVVTARFPYFVRLPDQVTSQRYVPWSMLLWLGLALSFVLRPGRSVRTGLTVPLLVGVLMAPSQVWTGRYAWKQQRTAELTALGAAVGVLDRSFPLVETNPKDLLAAVPLLRAAKKAMFAWSEVALLGTHVSERWEAVAATDLTVTSVTNLFDGPGCEVQFELARAPAARLLLLDADGTARGLAIACGPGAVCRGWLRGTIEAANLNVVVLR